MEVTAQSFREAKFAKRRLLKVSSISATGIIPVSKNGSDPYIKMYLMDLGGREIKAESFKSKSASKTVTPRWSGESFEFGNSYDLDTNEELPSLKFLLFHKGAFSTSEVPLGEVEVDMNTLDSSTTMTYPIEKSGRMKTVSGELTLTLEFSREVTPPDLADGADVEAALADDEEIEGAEEEEPNELNVAVVQARNLLIMDKKMFGGGSSDPQVRLEIDGHETKKTKYISKNLNPVFNEKFVFPRVLDGSCSMRIIVEDHNDFKFADLIGKVPIQIQDFDNKKPVKKWYKLRNKNMEMDGKERGEIELLIHWKFNPEIKQQMYDEDQKKKSSLGSKLGTGFGKLGRAIGVVDTDSEDSGLEDDDDKLDETERPKTEEEKEEDKKKDEEKRAELSEIEIKDGDYQIQVHIIECRDLKAENFDGTSDPVVYVETFGQKQSTIVIKQVTSCVFDELMIFNLKNLDKEQFEDGLIRIACYDSSIIPLVGNTMIGTYVIDATMVYNMNKDHEIYRQWVPLIDDEDPDDIGVQGYMKISIQIIGPGEKIKIHDEDAERAEEIRREAASGGDIGSLVLSTPVIRKEWNFVVCSVYKCEGLPIMDGAVGIGMVKAKKAGTDAFCKLEFAGGRPIKTKVVTKEGTSRDQINPEFNYELWYPVSCPTMTQGVKFSVWDKDPAKSELIGGVMEKFNVINRTDRKELPLKWYCMYGAHEFKQEKLAANLKKAAVEVHRKTQQALGNEIDWFAYYNTVPEKATAYKGRALLKFRIESRRPKKWDDKPAVKPFRRRIKPLKRAQEPALREYKLKALVIMGNELPQFGNITSDQLRVKVSVGVHELCTNPAKFENGTCRWNQLMTSEVIHYPKDLTQLPDLFVYLVRENDKPVCFKRFKPVHDAKNDLMMGFDDGADWHLLQEDKAIDALNTDVFPGQVLIKIGFGLASEADACHDEWKQCLESSKKGTPYQVRVHLYQGKELPAADMNGLCDPYVKVNFMGQTRTSDKKEDTLYPGYYQTFVFDTVMLPEFKNFTYASMVSFRLYDSDFDGDDYLGTCMYHLQDSIVSEDVNTDFGTADTKLPTWLKFFKEVPGDSTGELLVLVQLIPTLGNTIGTETRSIMPKTRKGYIEFIVIGVRDMLPYNFQMMQSPFLEIALNSFGTEYLSATAPSKRPDPSDPNFLEKIMMPVMLPEESIYSSPLQIRAKDMRLGGYLTPTVGVCAIDLSTKIPWCKDTYKAPQTDMFMQPKDDRGAVSHNSNMDGVLPGQNADATALELMELQLRRDSELIQDDFIAQPEPISVDQYLKSRIAVEDTGAGVFGALNHIDTTGNAKKKAVAEDAFTDPDWTQDDGESPPDWSINRKKLEAELEAEFKTTPFETYKLMRGKATGMFGPTLKVVGRLKGLVRVVEDPDEPPLLSADLMKQLLVPKKYVIRLYALTGKALASMDYDMMGRPAKSDPYLKVRLGKQIFDDRSNAVDDVTEVDFYKVIEFNTELPGTSQLVITVMDKDLIGSDDLIGRTTVDLEDRWFDKRWQEWGNENKKLPGDDPKDPTKVRWQTKPVERRSLYVPSKHIGQGVVECWVDIMTPEVAGTFPPDDVSLPPTQMFEVRVVIWKAKNVPPQDWLEGMSDLFMKVWPEGCKIQETDTHWRAKRGKASWNYRLLFNVELGHSTRAMKFPYLHLQLWDRDIIKWNDCAGEGMIDLGRYYRKAYKRNLALKLFETKKGALAKRASAHEKSLRLNVADTTEDIPPDEYEDEDVSALLPSNDLKDGDVVNPMTAGAAATAAAESKGDEPLADGVYAAPNTLLPPRDEADSDDDDEFAQKDAGLGAIPRDGERLQILPPKRNRKKRPKKQQLPQEDEDLPPPRPSRFEWLAFWRSHPQPHLDEEGNEIWLEDVQAADDDEQLDTEHKKQDEDEDGELKALITTFKGMTGLWDVDPEDSSWLHISQQDKNTGEVAPQGSICYSVQIWPKDKAIVMKAGAARNEPNSNPFLPPPVGRLRFSWNPFVLGSELCGPFLCAQLFCCLIVIAFVALMIFCQPFLNIIINLIFVVY